MLSRGERLILKLMYGAGATDGRLVSIRDLRRAIGHQMTAGGFNQCLLSLMQSCLFGHRHDHTASLTARERAELVRDPESEREIYFVGVTLRD